MMFSVERLSLNTTPKREVTMERLDAQTVTMVKRLVNECNVVIATSKSEKQVALAKEFKGVYERILSGDDSKAVKFKKGIPLA